MRFLTIIWALSYSTNIFALTCDPSSIKLDQEYSDTKGFRFTCYPHTPCTAYTPSYWAFLTWATPEQEEPNLHIGVYDGIVNTLKGCEYEGKELKPFLRAVNERKNAFMKELGTIDVFQFKVEDIATASYVYSKAKTMLKDLKKSHRSSLPELTPEDHSQKNQEPEKTEKTAAALVGTSGFSAPPGQTSKLSYEAPVRKGMGLMQISKGGSFIDYDLWTHEASGSESSIKHLKFIVPVTIDQKKVNLRLTLGDDLPSSSIESNGHRLKALHIVQRAFSENFEDKVWLRGDQIHAISVLIEKLKKAAKLRPRDTVVSSENVAVNVYSEEIPLTVTQFQKRDGDLKPRTVTVKWRINLYSSPELHSKTVEYPFPVEPARNPASQKTKPKK